MTKKVVVLAAILFAVFVGVAYAAIPDSNGVIHACYGGDAMKNGNAYGTGTLRVIDTEQGQACTSGETALSWNQTGQQGPVGPKGDTGTQGPAGPQGPQGPSGVVSGEEAQSDVPITSNSSAEVEAASMQVPTRNSSGGSEEYYYSFNGLVTATGAGDTTVECLVFGIDANSGNYYDITTQPEEIRATSTGTEISGSGITNGLGFLSAPTGTLEVKCQDNDGAIYTYQTSHMTLTLLPVQGSGHVFDG